MNEITVPNAIDAIAKLADLTGLGYDNTITALEDCTLRGVEVQAVLTVPTRTAFENVLEAGGFTLCTMEDGTTQRVPMIRGILGGGQVAFSHCGGVNAATLFEADGITPRGYASPVVATELQTAETESDRMSLDEYSTAIELLAARLDVPVEVILDGLEVEQQNGRDPQAALRAELAKGRA